MENALSTIDGTPLGVAFDDAAEQVRTRAKLTMPDRVVPISRLTFMENGTMEVPESGRLALTEWSQAQLARMLGIRWQRWLASDLVSPAERAEEVNRRLARQTTNWKIRARSYGRGEDGPGDGILRAFVTPTYAPIDDARMFEHVGHVLGPRRARCRLVRLDLTDRASYYVAINEEPVSIGRGRRDPHCLGFLIRNSEVGAAALFIDEYVFRVACTNGIMFVIAGKRLFYRVHRAASDESIERDVARALAQLPKRWEDATLLLGAARAKEIADPEDVLRARLGARREIRRHIDAIITAYRHDPEPTWFGVAQAVTFAAQRFHADTRHALETFAGQIIVHAATP